MAGWLGIVEFDVIADLTGSVDFVACSDNGGEGRHNSGAMYVVAVGPKEDGA